MIPNELNTAEFLAAWDLWQQHRRETRKKLTPTSQVMQLKKLAAWGPVRAVAAIERSIEMGWMGLFEPPVSAVAKAVDPPVVLVPTDEPAVVESAEERAKRLDNVRRIRAMAKEVGRMPGRVL